jgi:hypothetical protein
MTAILDVRDATRLRKLALTIRNAVDAFRVHSADRQPLETLPAMFGHPGTHGIETAAALDAACEVWLNERGFTVTREVTP